MGSTGGIVGDNNIPPLDEQSDDIEDIIYGKKKRTGDIQDIDMDGGDEEISPVSATVDLIVALSQIFLKDTEIGVIIETFSPLLKKFGEKIFGDDDLDFEIGNQESADDSDYVDSSSDTQSGTLTGGASEIEDSSIYQDYTTGEPVVDVSTPEKVEKLMYPDEIAGVKRGEPKSLLDVAQRGVNPKYCSEEDIEGEYSNNCQSCVVAAELMIRGYNVEAVGASNPIAQELKSSNVTAYIDPETGKECAYDTIYYNEISCYDYLEKNVKVGERYELSYNDPLENQNGKMLSEYEKNGHVVIITRDDKYGLILYDPQNNEMVEGVKVKKFLEPQFQYKTPVIAPKILRIDNKLLNPKYVNAVVRKRNVY